MKVENKSLITNFRGILYPNQGILSFRRHQTELFTLEERKPQP